MRLALRAALLLALVAVAAACASGRDETWIGRNVGVTVDSSAERAK